MKLKTLGVFMLGLGAAITTSCGGARNLNYSDASKFVETNYTHSDEDLILLKWQTLNWDFSASTGTNCINAIKAMLDDASDYCLNVIELKMEKQNIPGYRSEYYNLASFKSDFVDEHYANSVNAKFVADGKKLTITFDSIYAPLIGGPYISCKETEIYGEDGRSLRSKYVFEDATIPGATDGKVNGWIEYVYNY